MHDRVHKSPPLGPILNHVNAVRKTQHYSSEIDFNIILQTTAGPSLSKSTVV